MLKSLKKKAGRIKRELTALQVALTYPGVPWYAKALIVLAIAYAVSPIDLIPDFIPVLGILDDLILIPLLIYLALKSIPQDILEDCKKIALQKEFIKKRNWWVPVLIILFWIGIGIWIYIKFLPDTVKLF